MYDIKEHKVLLKHLTGAMIDVVSQCRLTGMNDKEMVDDFTELYKRLLKLRDRLEE